MTDKPHIGRLAFYIQSAGDIFSRCEENRPCYIVFGLYGQFFRTSIATGAALEWNEVQTFDVPSDLLSFYVSIRDEAAKRLAEKQCTLRELETDTKEASVLYLNARTSMGRCPFIVYRSAVVEWRIARCNRTIDRTFELLPVFAEPFKNIQTIEWNWIHCLGWRRSTSIQTKNRSKKATIQNVQAEKHCTATSFADSVNDLCTITSINPNCAPASGGTTVLISGKNFGSRPEEIQAILLAGNDCTAMIKKHSPRQLMIKTKSFYPMAAPVIIATTRNGVAVSKFKFTYYGKPTSNMQQEAKRGEIHSMHKQLCDSSSQTASVICVPAEQQVPVLLTENLALKEEIGRLKEYLDELVNKIMIQCPEILSSNCK